MFNIKLWNQDFNRAKNYAERYPLSATIFNFPNSIWLTGNKKKLSTIGNSITRVLERANGHAPTFVIYAIPDRDLGQHSAGGLSYIEYKEYCASIAASIGDKAAIVIVEPDAIPHTKHMDPSSANRRLRIISEVVAYFSKCKRAKVYIDVGHSSWLTPPEAKRLLKKSGIQHATGFSVNVSNYRNTSECVEWGNKISELFNGKKTYVVDTSRNGRGPYGEEWCNPPERAIGEFPTLNTGIQHCDAYLWIKVPGESDGKCNGGPKAGKFWPEQAVSLVTNSTRFEDFKDGTE